MQESIIESVFIMVWV